MKKTGIFYGPMGGSTERVAQLIFDELGEENAVLIPVKNSGADELKSYDKIVFGISTIGKETWDAQYKNNDWDVFFPLVEEIDFSGKTVALFGLGDSVSYSGFFVDAMGKLGKLLIEKNANIIGQTSPLNYTFDESEALIDGSFIGLPIDEDFEDHLTKERVKDWVDSIREKIL